MNDPTLQQLFTPFTRDDILASELSVAQRIGLPATAWQPQSVGREVLAITAQEIADYSVIGSSGAAAGGLLDYATGDWLTLLAISNFGVRRIAATFGTAPVTLANSSIVDFTFDAGTLICVNVRTGETYENTDQVVLLASSTVDATVIAQSPGTASNANPGEIAELQTPLLGVTVTNAASLVGEDEQTDASLKNLCRLSMARASPNGPVDAYNYFAQTALRDDGTNVGVTRTSVVQPVAIPAIQPSVVVYVASATGPIPGSALDPSTDLGSIHVNIQNNCVPTGITESTASAAAHLILIEATVWRANTSTLSDLAMQTLVLQQLTAYFSLVPIGGYDIGSGGQIFLDAIIGQIFLAAPGQILQATVSLPVADINLAANEIPTLTSIAASFTIMQAP